jgi:hypothetical protein
MPLMVIITINDDKDKDKNKDNDSAILSRVFTRTSHAAMRCWPLRVQWVWPAASALPLVACFSALRSVHALLSRKTCTT